jgi:hypothetical protein
MASLSSTLRNQRGALVDELNPENTEPSSEGIYFLNSSVNYLIGKGVPAEEAKRLYNKYSEKGPSGFRTSRKHPGMVVAELDELAVDYGNSQTPEAVVRDPADEVRRMIEALQEAAPEQYSLELAYRPKFAELEQAIMQKTLTGRDDPIPVMQWYEQEFGPAASRITADASRRQRESDIIDVETLGPRASEAFRAANPELTETMDFLRRQAIEPSAISQELESQALEELRLGEELTPEERRQVQQDSRAAYSARGLVESGPAAADEILALYGAGENRQANRRSFASSVEAARLQRGAFAGNVANLQARTTTDPFQAILGRPAAATGFGLQEQAFGNELANAGPQNYDPFSGYASNLYSQNSSSALDIWGTNLSINQQEGISADELAAANRASKRGFAGDVFGGILSAGGSIYGSSGGR